jgi:hypothetical protein
VELGLSYEKVRDRIVDLSSGAWTSVMSR